MTTALRGSAWRSCGVLLVALLLGACANTARFPSLARRSAEAGSGEPTPDAAPSVAPTGASAPTVASLVRLRGAAAAAHARFAIREAGAERAAADAGPQGSESWAAASVALAALEEAHDQQTAALAEIDQLQVDRQVADAGSDSPDTTAILAARDEVASVAEADGAIVDRLRARLGR